jgi:2-phosphosulfolactate phosphatase
LRPVRFQPHYVNIEAASAIEGGTAVVLDVLRAYTTAAWAFALGAERIVLSDDTDEALALKARFPRALALKDSRPYDGFELTNSPVELQSHDLQGRTIVQRTTAGTVGAVAAKQAEHLYCAGFLNAAATAAAIRRSGAAEAYFVVTGEDGAGDEDRACAEYIAALVEAPATDAAPYLRRVAESRAARLMAERVAHRTPGVHARDVEAAMEADRFDFVMVAREEQLEGAGPILVLRAYNRSDD